MVNWLKYVFMALTSSVGDLKPLSWNQELQLKCWQFFFFTLYFLFSSKWMNTWLRLGPWMVDPSEALHSRLRLHQGHAGGLVVVRVDGWHHLAADWVEDGQGGERPGDLTVLGHAPQLLCGLLDGTVMNQLDAEGWRRLVFVCFFFHFPTFLKALQVRLSEEICTQIVHARQIWHVTWSVLGFFFICLA